MNYLKTIGTVLLIITTTAAAIGYCHRNFAPKSIVDSVEQTRAVVCMIAIDTLPSEKASKHCGDIINRY